MGMIFFEIFEESPNFKNSVRFFFPPEGKKTEKSDSVEVGRRAYVITWKNKNNTPLVNAINLNFYFIEFKKKLSQKEINVLIKFPLLLYNNSKLRLSIISSILNEQPITRTHLWKEVFGKNVSKM